MCRVLDVAPAGYYAWCNRSSPCARAIADERLVLNIRLSHAASAGTYGSPRVLRDLRDEGLRVGKKRVARLMQREGLKGRSPRGFVRTTDSNHTHPVAPNLLQRQFAVTGLAVNRVSRLAALLRKKNQP